MEKKWMVLLPCAAALAADLIIKRFTEHHAAVLIPGVLSLSPVRNTGFALGLFPDASAAALMLSGVMIVSLILLMACFSWNRAALTGFGLTLGGALGNLFDRLTLGCVRDMFHLDFMQFYVFNLADVFVIAGVVLIALSTLTDKRSPACRSRKS